MIYLQRTFSLSFKVKTSSQLFFYCIGSHAGTPGTPAAMSYTTGRRPKETGETTAAKVFLSLVGHEKKNLTSQLPEVECMTQSSMSSFPYVYDEPDDLTSVKSLINNLFNGQAKSSTHGTMQHSEWRRLKRSLLLVILKRNREKESF